MDTFRKLAIHRPWEDWLLLALGLLICFSPSLAESGYSGAPAASALIAGFIIIFVAQLEIGPVSLGGNYQPDLRRLDSSGAFDLGVFRQS